MNEKKDVQGVPAITPSLATPVAVAPSPSADQAAALANAPAHSPLPWHIGKPNNRDEDGVKLGIREEEQWVIADVHLNVRTWEYGDGQGRVNAEFIVRACNSHYEREALIRELIETAKQMLEFEPVGSHMAELIAKAEGR